MLHRLSLACCSLRIQALLNLRLFKLKKIETAKLRTIIDQHTNSRGGCAKTSVPSPYQPTSSTSSSTTVGVASSTTPTVTSTSQNYGGGGGGNGGGGGGHRSGATPPLSPQPSPAGSVNSVGSGVSQGVNYLATSLYT
jgi:hypothetical protein